MKLIEDGLIMGDKLSGHAIDLSRVSRIVIRERVGLAPAS